METVISGSRKTEQAGNVIQKGWFPQRDFCTSNTKVPAEGSGSEKNLKKTLLTHFILRAFVAFSYPGICSVHFHTWASIVELFLHSREKLEQSFCQGNKIHFEDPRGGLSCEIKWIFEEGIRTELSIRRWICCS